MTRTRPWGCERGALYDDFNIAAKQRQELHEQFG
jgi:hypothetical protein